MLQTFLTWICLTGAAALFAVFAFLLVSARVCAFARALLARYRRQPRLVQAFLAVFALVLFLHGAAKPPSPPSPRLAPSPDALPEAEPNASCFSDDELASGYVPWRVGTNETWDFSPPPDAQVVASWRLRGAADDWTLCPTTNMGPVVMTTDGRLFATNAVYDVFSGGALALVPETNWPRLGTNAPSRAWWAETPWRSTLFTWQGALLGRDTNVPVSVQAEFAHTGDWICRYALSAAGTNLTSRLFYRIRPEDLLSDDRDGDGLCTRDEITLHHTDPGLADSDGDGIPDGEEVWNGMDPTTRSVPDDAILSRVAASATNEAYLAVSEVHPDAPLASVKLWDGFAADVPPGSTGLLYERTLDLGTANGWQRWFLSSRPDAAGGWDLRGVILEWKDGGGRKGELRASPDGDSVRLPLAGSTLTIRLRATGPKVRCPTPVYLIGYAPKVTLTASGGQDFGDGGSRAFVFLSHDGEGVVLVSVDRSHRPCRAAIPPDELALPGIDTLASETRGALSFSGDADGGMITVTRPYSGRLPDIGIGLSSMRSSRPRRARSDASGAGTWIVCLDPSVSYGGEHRFVSRGLTYDEASGDYEIEYCYPLGSRCLWRSWQRSIDGEWGCDCSPQVKVGAGADDLSFVETSHFVSGKVATGIVRVFGREAWRGTATHDWRDVGNGGGKTTGCELLSELDACGDGCVSGCEDGSCDDASGPEFGSVSFRLSLGVLRRGQHAGFLSFRSEGPVAIVPELFALTARADVPVSQIDAESAVTYACDHPRGRDVVLLSVPDGVRLTVRAHATGRLEETWDVFNPAGDTNTVRIVQTSRLGNVMRDETFTCAVDGSWTRTDGISGVSETLARACRLNDPSDGRLVETRTRWDADGRLVESVTTEMSRIGKYGSAVLRETYRARDTGVGVSWRNATYWDDPGHPDRHGQVRLVQGNDTAWQYHDWDTRGFETLRVEQRNGSPVPALFPEVIGGNLMFTGGLADAFVTVFDYEPSTGDDTDDGRPRRETRYVVRNGVATVIGRTWWAYYPPGQQDGYETETMDRWRAGSQAGLSNPSANGNASFNETTFRNEGEGTPHLLRGAVITTFDENGGCSWNSYTQTGGVLVCTAEDMSGPTYEVTERDVDTGTVLRRTTRLTDGDAVIADEISTYDEKDRLRSTSYLDGTSLTNAYSCCRLLWTRDREGRRTLRSARTGTDHLYRAEEDVWLADVSTNGGYRVTRRFFDGFGRETNTVVCAGMTPGEAATPTGGTRAVVSAVTTAYPFGGDGCSVRTDERGVVTVRRTDFVPGGVETVETVLTNGVEVVRTKSRSVFGGGTSTRREWGISAAQAGTAQCAVQPEAQARASDKFTEERRFDDYDVEGRRIAYVVTESSDYGTVTNSVTTYDLLGRVVSTAVRGANGSTIVTANAYDGATTRLLSAATTGSPVVTYGYNEFGERISASQDGKSILSDTTYEIISGAVYRVATTVRMTGGVTNAVQVRKVQLTGLSDALRSRTVSVAASGQETVAETAFDATTGILTSVSQIEASTPVTARSICGVTLDQTSIDGASEMSYDALGRNVAVTASDASGATNRVDSLEYDQSGNVVRRVTDFRDGRVAEATAEYDMLNREVRRTDALGNETVTGYDPLGRTVSTSGDAYPILSGFDSAGRKTHGFTTRDGGATWDETQWEFDPASGVNTAKEYADGSRVAYSYTDNGKKTRTTWARGVWKQHVYNVRNLVSGTTYSGTATPSVAYTYADSGKTASATLSDGTSYAYGYEDRLLNTNESVTIGGTAFSVNRTFDEFRRAQETAVVVTNVRHSAKVRLYDSEDRVCGYALTNAAGRGVPVSLAYDGSYVTNTVYTLPNGSGFSARLSREAGRRNLVTRRDYFFGGQSIYWYSTEYDLLNRPTNASDSVSLAREWLYNRRSELAAATVGTNRYGYAYDTIGNRLWAAANAVTNSYAANSLNQYTAISANANPVYDADGNMTNDGSHSYSYDEENRLIATYPLSPAVGSLAVVNRYDHKHRRVQKTVKRFDGAAWEVAETHTFVWDGNNIVLEKIEFADGTTRTFEYFWGVDKSGTEQGAGGVEGLLAVSMDGVFYIPCYDHNGNIVLYVSETGGVAAQYTYDPYGNIIEASGSLADVFSFGFSTQYHDRDTGMVGYKRRFYRPDLGRWLNRDPIEESGGENLYAFCANNPILYYDILGEDFWGYFMDGVKMVAGALSFVAGAKITIASGGIGGALGGMSLMAYGMDQMYLAFENMKSRYQGRGLPTGSVIQRQYREVAYQITGEHGSGIETTFDYAYRTYEIFAACATGWAAVSRSVNIVRQVGPLQSVGHWGVSAKGMVEYQISIEGGVSGSYAGGVIAVETFNVIINWTALLPSPEENDNSIGDIEGGNR